MPYLSHTCTYTHTQERIYFVLDTNVLLSHLEFLVELKDSAIKGSKENDAFLGAIGL